MLPQIPTQVLSRHSNTRVLAIESVQVFEVGAHDITDFFSRQRLAQFSGGEKEIDFIEDPWPTLSSASNEYAITLCLQQNFLRALRRVDVAIGKYGNLNVRFDQGHGFVLGIPLIHVGAGSAMNGERLDALRFGD